MVKLVVDANVLFAMAKPSSAANELVSRFSLKLLAPDFSFYELIKYKKDLVNKSGESFDSIIELLKEKVAFLEVGHYASEIKKLSAEISDPKDIVYLALAYRTGVPIWSNDKHFKEQDMVEVFTTRELIELLGD
ncbi:MAG: PIN domain-containing protein [archaeon]